MARDSPSNVTVCFSVLSAPLRAVGVPGPSVGAAGLVGLIVRVVVALIEPRVGALETLLS